MGGRGTGTSDRQAKPSGGAGIKGLHDFESFRGNEHRGDGSIEWGYGIDANGSVVIDRQGVKSQVDVTSAEANALRNGVFTHNHPLGGSFSMSDGRFSIRRDLKEIRAVGTNELGEKHVHILRRPGSKWGATSEAFQASYKKHDAKVSYDFWRAVHIEKRMSKQRAGADHYHEVLTRTSAELGLHYERKKVK